MISIAILAIVFAVSTGNWHRSQAWLLDEMDRSRAAQMLANAADATRLAPYDELRAGAVSASDGEARHVDADGLVSLANTPVVRVLGVDTLDAGGHMTPVQDVTLEGNRLRLPRAMAGKPVRIRYVGRYTVQATWQNVDSNLRQSATASQGRLVTLQVLDQGSPIPSLSVTVLRMKP